MSAPANLQKIRRVVWTGAIVAVTVTGTLYGAGLKTGTETKKAAQKRHEATPAEMIKILEVKRGDLVAKKLALEKKLHEIDLRAAGATRAESMEGMERKRAR